MPDSEISSLSQSLSELYGMIYEAVSYNAKLRNLNLPPCLSPQKTQEMDFDNIPALQELVDSVKSLYGFVQSSGILNESTRRNAQRFLQEEEGKDTPAVNIVDRFMELMNSLKIAIKNKDLETKYQEAMQANAEAIEAIMYERSVIDNVAAKIEAGGFPIDARKLAKNFLNASKKDPDAAYEILITNPAYFSPLLLHGKNSIWRRISGKGPKMPAPEIGQKINRELALFLKKLKF